MVGTGGIEPPFLAYQASVMNHSTTYRKSRDRSHGVTAFRWSLLTPALPLAEHLAGSGSLLRKNQFVAACGHIVALEDSSYILLLQLFPSPSFHFLDRMTRYDRSYLYYTFFVEKNLPLYVYSSNRIAPKSFGLNPSSYKGETNHSSSLLSSSSSSLKPYSFLSSAL